MPSNPPFPALPVKVGLKKQVKTPQKTAEIALPKDFRPTAQDLKDAPQRVKKILSVLQKTHPDAKIALNFSNPLELLVATVAWVW